MAALLTAMSITAIALAAALPAWQQMMQRENEEELVFRGEQYSHAIALFQRKFANSAPPNIDVLVDQRFLRKKYKDPITNDDSVPISIARKLVAAPRRLEHRRVAPRRRTGQRTARRFGSCRWTPHGGARRARNRALMMVTERSRGGGLH